MKHSVYLEKAVRLAAVNHEGQVDKGGSPYIFHLLRVMEKMPDDDLKTVAVLHDMLEDTDVSEEKMQEEGIPQRLIAILKILNKKQYGDYDEYIDHVARDRAAARVKMADLEDNMNIIRLEEIDENVVDHLKKYHKAWKRLKRDTC